MKFAELTGYFQTLSKTSSRNSMTEIVAQLLGDAKRDEVKQLVYLMLGQLGPRYATIEFQLAEKMVIRTLAETSGKDVKEITKTYKTRGDLGLVAEAMISRKDSRLGAVEVYEKLEKIARESGTGSQERKVKGLSDLLGAMSGQEAKYVIRVVLGKLRLGFSDKTILDAISVMERGDKEGRSVLEQAYQMQPDIGTIAQLTKAYGIRKVSEHIEIHVGVPLMPALCQRLKTADEMIAKMGEVEVEPKFDGTRVQIHFARRKGKATSDKQQATGKYFLKTFTRNLEETTQMFPELAEAVSQIKAESAIFDSEAVGVHPKTGKLLPFQVTMTRKRKHGITDAARTVPLKFFVFDLLYKDGKALIGKPLSERRKILRETIAKGKVLEVDEVMVTKNADELRDYHSEKLKEGLEGVVVKQAESTYEPGRRGYTWVKFKEVEEASGKLSDTIDAVVLGYYRGRGKRAAFGIGAFLVGVRDNGGLVTMAKIGTGLSDVQWKELKKRLESVVAVEQPPHYKVNKALTPDVWVEPEVVVEIAADEITKSPVHTAGYALRFPRLVRFRDDKAADQATSLEEMMKIK